MLSVSYSEVCTLAGEAVRLYTDPGDQKARHLGGLLARELARQAPEAFAGQAAQARAIGH